MGGISFISSMRRLPKKPEPSREMIEAEFKGIQIQMMDLSPVFVAQGGPWCVAIQYIER